MSADHRIDRPAQVDSDSWDLLSEWAAAWQHADASERDRLRAAIERRRPDLLPELDAMSAAADRLDGFLETPAVVVAAASLAQDESPLPRGTMVGPYRVIDFIARGGMGDVYRATDTRLGRDVAVKMLAATKTSDPQRVARFMHEARVTASLDHPNIVRVFDVGRTEDGAYLVAELLEGETLRQVIERGPLAIDEILRIGGDIARGLGAAHAAGLVHRDLKPENVFVTHAGATRILDFGIAKLAQDEQVRDGFSTLTGVVLGTAGYLAPEQIRGADVDPRADLFALGAVLFEMLTGARAFAREHVVETLHAILHDHPPDLLAARADAPPGLAGIVSRLLEKDAEARFQSSAEVLAALSNVTAATAAQATTAASAPRVTLAVMPFRTIPAGAGNDFLDVGLADVFISRLSQLSGVRVLPLTATERLREQDPRRAARQLGANRALVMTLQRDSGLVRASVHLLSVIDEHTVWTTTVDTDAASIFSIQDIIVTRLIEELAPQLAATSRARLAKPGTRHNAAFEAYLRGRVHVARPTSGDLQQAVDCFHEALRLDDSYADAWAGLGSAYKRQPVVTGAAADAFCRAREAATRALRLDPDHAEAHSVLGTVAFWYEWDFAGAERHFRRSLELQPSAPDTQVFLAHLYSNLGRADEAIEEIRRARALDPEWTVPRALEGQFLYMARRFDQSLAHLDAARAIARGHTPARLFRIWTLAAVGRYEEALHDSERMLTAGARPDPLFGPLEMKGVALAHLGRCAEAEAVLEELRARQRNRALVLHALSRDDEALAEVARAIEARDVAVTFLGVDPRWDALRRHPSFISMLARVGLLEASNRLPH
jgi:serine/threonine-protein kinase